jgi:hypothetical protein
MLMLNNKEQTALDFRATDAMVSSNRHTRAMRMKLWEEITGASSILIAERKTKSH